MNLSFRTANVGNKTVTLNGGRAVLLGIHFGEYGEIYLQEGVITNFNLGLDPFGAVSFGSEDTLLEATNFRVLGIPIPRLQSHLAGDERGVSLKGIVGDVFGYDYDGFDIANAKRAELEHRAVEQGYLSRDEARRKTEEQLKELVGSKEVFNVDLADLEALREHVKAHAYVTPSKSHRLSAGALRAIIREKRKARALGIVDGEGSHLSIGWNGEFTLRAFLRDVYVGRALAALGATTSDIHGRLKSRLWLQGDLDKLSSWKGRGWVQAGGVNIVKLPLFLNVLKTLDPSLLLAPPTRTSLRLVEGLIRRSRRKLATGSGAGMGPTRQERLTW